MVFRVTQFFPSTAHLCTDDMSKLSLCPWNLDSNSYSTSWESLTEEYSFLLRLGGRQIGPLLGAFLVAGGYRCATKADYPADFSSAPVFSPSL